MRYERDTGLPENGGVVGPAHSQGLYGVKQKLVLVAQGFTGGLIGSVCCLLPAMAIAIGLTGGLTATLVGLGKFRLYGILAGLVFVAIASSISLRRRRSCCTEEEYKRLLITIPFTMLVSFGFAYGLVMYLIVPILYKL